jgi:hypothetical protein
MKANSFASGAKLQVQSSKETKSQIVICGQSDISAKDSFNYLLEDEDLKEAVRATSKELASITNALS